MILDNFPKTMLSKDMLYRYEYFGQYGNVIKIDIIPNNEISVTLYVTFAKPFETSLAVLSLNDFNINGLKLKAKFDTPQQREKLYNRINLKYKIDETKLNRDHQVLAIKLSDIYNKNIQQNILKQCMNKRTIFPSPLTIFSRNKIVMESGNNPLQKIKSNKANRSRFDFIIEDQKDDIYEKDKEPNNEYEEIPKYILSFINRIYELSFKMKKMTNNFNFLLLCQMYKNKENNPKEMIPKSNKKENENTNDWFDFLYENFTEENKDSYKNLYENETKEILDWSILDSPRNENEIEYQKDFDEISEISEISEGIRHMSTEESEYSEN